MKNTMTAFGLLKKPKIGNVPEKMGEVTVSVPEINSNQVLVKIIASIIHVDDIALVQGTALGRFLGPKRIDADCPFRKLISHTIMPPTVHNGDVDHRPLEIVLPSQ
jgi:hypothetical protein